MEEAAHHLCAIPERQRQRHGPIQGHVASDRGLARRAQDRQADLSLCSGNPLNGRPAARIAVAAQAASRASPLDLSKTLAAWRLPDETPDLVIACRHSGALSRRTVSS